MFACLFAPDFSIQAAIRIETNNTRETLKQSPLVILDGPTNLPRVVALNKAASSLGIEIGMTKLQVETCGGVLIRKRSPANEDALQAALLDCGMAFSPCSESTCPGIVIIDLRGTEKLFGSPEKTANKIVLHGCDCGLELHVGIAANPDTAMYSARGHSGITIIPEGEEAKRLAPLDINILPLSLEMSEILDSWGVHTLQSLAALPPIALTERLGQEGLQLQKLASGKTYRLLVPTELNGDLIETYEFDDPVENLESLTFILNRVIQQLCFRLISRSLATNQFEVNLVLETWQIQTGQNSEQYKRVWKLPLPIQDSRVLFRLAYLDLEKNSFSAPIKKITVRVVPTKPRSVQHGLFVPVSPEAEQLEITLARIRSIVGDNDENGIPCVGSPTVLDSHRPDSFSTLPFSSELNRASPISPASISALRVFRPALETSVDLITNQPHCFSIRKKRFRVLAASGPWRNSGQWWDSSTSWSRDEWDVAVSTSEGIGYYRIYLDKILKRWFVEGILD